MDILSRTGRYFLHNETIEEEEEEDDDDDDKVNGDSFKSALTKKCVHLPDK
jgi:hypothetical protein